MTIWVHKPWVRCCLIFSAQLLQPCTVHTCHCRTVNLRIGTCFVSTFWRLECGDCSYIFGKFMGPWSLKRSPSDPQISLPLPRPSIIRIVCESSTTLTHSSTTLTHSSATLTEVFPCFFLGCKANARVKLAKTGHGPHSSKLIVIALFCRFLCCSVVIVLYCCYLCCSVIIYVAVCTVCV